MSKRSAKSAGLAARIGADDNEVLVPQTPLSQPDWRTPPASPSPYAPSSPNYVPSSPCYAPANPDDRITSKSSAAPAAASVAVSPRDPNDAILLFLVGEAGRSNHRTVAVYRSRVDALDLRADWWEFMNCDGRTINRNVDKFPSLCMAFARLSCAHPRIADADARAWLHDEPFMVPYRYALPPELDTPLSITAIIHIYPHD